MKVQSRSSKQTVGGFIPYSAGPCSVTYVDLPFGWSAHFTATGVEIRPGLLVRLWQKLKGRWF